MSRGAKIGLGVLIVLLLLIFVIVPAVIGIFAKDKVIAGIQAAIGAPVKASSVSINLLPPGASIGNLEVGTPDSAANGQPIAKIDSLTASVTWGTVFGGTTHVSSCSIHGMTTSVSVDEQGVSTLSRLLDGMPPSTRTYNLPIDSLVVKNLKTQVFLTGSKKTAGVSADQADGTLTIDYASVSGLQLAAPNKALGIEVWSTVAIEGIRMTAPTLGEDKNNGGLADGIYVGRIDSNFSQPVNANDPLRVKTVDISKLEIAQVYTTPDAEPAARRASWIIPMGLKPTAKGSKVSGIPEMLVSALTINGSRIETRGTDAAGAPAYWRLSALAGNATFLAFGQGIVAPGPGHIKIDSPTESSAGAGNVVLELKDITGSYPNWTFQCAYKLDGMAATPFSLPAQHAAGSGIKSGSVSMDFAGPSQNGRLQIDGSITLSKDLEVTGTVNNQIAKIVRGEPIRTVRIRGTLEKPDVQFPDAFAGLAEKMFQSIITGGPLGVVDAASGFMGSSVQQGVREASKGLEKGTDVLKKVPGVNKLFGK